MNKPQITIKDIARALNVSPSTVSRALKDNPDISKETRDLVHAYAREHNYKPNVPVSYTHLTLPTNREV